MWNGRKLSDFVPGHRGVGRGGIGYFHPNYHLEDRPKIRGNLGGISVSPRRIGAHQVSKVKGQESILAEWEVTNNRSTGAIVIMWTFGRVGGVTTGETEEFLNDGEETPIAAGASAVVPGGWFVSSLAEDGEWPCTIHLREVISGTETAAITGGSHPFTLTVTGGIGAGLVPNPAGPTIT
jgi:hypothetical protein